MRLLPLEEQQDDRNIYDTMHRAFLKEQSRKYDQTHTPTTRVFLIQSQQEIIGYAEVQLEEECFPDEDLPELCLKVYGFYIAPEKRKQKLGSEAFKLLRQWGREHKAALVEIEVNKGLASSNAFFKEQGLELVGSGKDNVFRGFI